jgi:hypothetical protein
LRQIERVSLPRWLFAVYYVMRVGRVIRTTVLGARLMTGRTRLNRASRYTFADPVSQ